MGDDIYGAMIFIAHSLSPAVKTLIITLLNGLNVSLFHHTKEAVDE